MADRIERAVTLGDLEGVVVPEHEHAGREADALGARREVAEGRQRVPVPTPSTTGLRRGYADVLGARHVVVAEPVRGFGDPGEVLDGAALLPLGAGTGRRRHHRCSHGELHRRSSGHPSM